MVRKFKNSNLNFDIEKILSYESLVITTDYNCELGFIIDINDNDSYFYSNIEERDYDSQLLFELSGF
jgi:hypothetical protein